MQVGGTEAALFDYARGGPQWGADALIIGPPQVITLPDLQCTPLIITLRCLTTVSPTSC